MLQKLNQFNYVIKYLGCLCKYQKIVKVKQAFKCPKSTKKKRKHLCNNIQKSITFAVF